MSFCDNLSIRLSTLSQGSDTQLQSIGLLAKAIDLDLKAMEKRLMSAMLIVAGQQPLDKD